MKDIEPQSRSSLFQGSKEHLAYQKNVVIGRVFGNQVYLHHNGISLHKKKKNTDIYMWLQKAKLAFNTNNMFFFNFVGLFPFIL